MITQADLDGFTGTENYYDHWLNKFVFTEGVLYLAENANAYWLIDAIASHQIRSLLKDPMLKEFQFWKLTVNSDKTATLQCLRDEGDIALTQNIPFTDFPLDTITLYLTNNVLLLPSEY